MPMLTKADVAARFAFAKRYRSKPKSFWQSKVGLHIELKNCPAYVTGQGRVYAAQREVRGAYRAPSQGLGEGYVVVPKNLRYNPGARPMKIAGGVGKGRVRLWHDIGRKWNAHVAADLYLGPVRAALKRASPRQRKFLLLEDNDPTGFKSKLGMAASAPSARKE